MDKETKESLDRIVNILAEIREQINPYLAGTFVSMIVSRLNAIEKRLEKIETARQNSHT